MGISLELKTSSNQHNSKTMQERIFLAPENRVAKHQDRSTLKSHFDPLYSCSSSSNLRSEITKEAARSSGTTHYGQSKHKSSAVEDGELVKHMTHLPGYLKGVEKAEKFQDNKVLNVGVLDWSRLEQWKHKQNNNVLEKGSSSNSLPKRSSKPYSSSIHTSRLSKVRPTIRPSVASSRNVERSVETAVRFQDRAIPSRSTVAEKETMKGVGKSFSTSLHPMENSCSRHGTSKKGIDASEEAEIKRKSVDQKTFGEISARSVRTRSRVQDLKQSNFDFADQSFPEQGKRIVLLLPKESPEKGFSEVPKISRHRLSLDKTSTASRKCSFSEDISFEDIAVGTRDITELPSTSSHASPCSEKKRDLHSERESRNSRVKAPIEMPSQELAQPTGSNSRNPSPLRRFSFSFGRMGRSFSFKEDTTIPQLSTTHVSVKSGPLSFDASNSVDNPNNEKAKSHNRARSSPLRRLLDPILKHKEPNPASHNHLLPPKVSLNSFSSGPIYSFPNEKTQESQVQALVQLKLNNGIPLFKFVVNNSSNILAATMKSLGSSDKDDSGRSYTFYLVNEVKKKSSGWISQGSKVKNCGYAYNVVGQMKVSASEFARESVLFGVERKQADQGSPKFVPNRELAAAVVEIPKSESEWSFPESWCSSCSVSVVLAGGVHGIPDKGEPSPLIHRWRSGGSCDCGGWDIGCKIQVLSDGSKCCGKASKAFKDGRILDSFELFAQGDEKDGPIFSLVPSKEGIYSVEYNTSISRLQAFFICVALLSGQKVTRLSSVGNNSESKPLDRADTSPDRGLLAKFPAKYATNPPLSPVGRV